MSDLERTLGSVGWVLLLIGAACISAAIGGHMGQRQGRAEMKRWQDEYYHTNPVMVQYRQQEIIVTPGDAVCPAGHICTWKAWDLDSQRPIGKIESTEEFDTGTEAIKHCKPHEVLAYVTNTGKFKCEVPKEIP